MINLLRYREWAAPRDGERLTSSATCRYAQAVLPILVATGGRPGYKCHPHADCGTTRRMIEVLRFVVGLAADVVRRRAGLVAENALLRQQLIVAQRKIAGRVRWAPWQLLHDGARSTPGAGVARRLVARADGDHYPIALVRLSRLLLLVL